MKWSVSVNLTEIILFLDGTFYFSISKEKRTMERMIRFPMQVDNQRKSKRLINLVFDTLHGNFCCL